MSNDLFSIALGGAGGLSATPSAASTGASAAAGAFAAVLARLEQPASAGGGEAAPGQGLAAAEAVGLEVGTAQWAAVTLSPALRVITDGQMDVGQDALLAFAQQQGMSAQAIEALRLQLRGDAESSTVLPEAAVLPAAFGHLPPTGVATPLASAPTAMPLQGSIGLMPLRGDAGVSVSVALGSQAAGLPSQAAGLPSQVAGLPSQVAGLPSQVTGLPSQVAGLPSQVTGLPSQVTGLPSQVAGLSTNVGLQFLSPAQAEQVVATAMQSSGQGVVPQALAAQQVGEPARAMPMSNEAEVALMQVLAGVRDGAARGAVATAAPAPSFMSDPAVTPASQLGVLTPPLNTVFKLSPVLQQAVVAKKGEAPAADLLVLDDVASVDVTDLIAQAPSLSRHAHAQSSLPSPAPIPGSLQASTPMASATPADMQAKYDTVAEKLGEAIGQRLQAQIQRGHWQVSLRLHPQELGSVDVQLGMRGGDLVASFQASQQMTRDMLQDQMPRLRDMLNGAGIDVASSGVGAQLGGRAGGNSTPSDRQASGAKGAENRPELAPTGVTRAQTAGLGQTGVDGLDLWA